MNRRLKTLLVTATLLILSLNLCCAQEDPEWWDISGQVLQWIANEIGNLGIYLFTWLGEGAAAVLNGIIIVYKAMILWNPNPEDMSPLIDRLMETLIPIYVLSITCAGAYFIFVAGAPSQRARAKDIFLKLILSMILVTISLQIYQVLLDLSLALSKRILAGTVIEGSALLGVIASVGLLVSWSTGFILPLSYLAIVIIAGVSIGLRHLLVQLMAAFFPLTLFLYFFEFTKPMGYKLMRYSMIAIFTQTIQALILAVSVAAVNSVAEDPSWMSAFFCLFIGMGGFILIAIAPLMLLGVMKWIGGAVAGVGTAVAFMPGKAALGGAMTAMGGVAAGMGPGGLIAGGTAYGIGRAYTMNEGTSALKDKYDELSGKRKVKTKRKRKDKPKRRETSRINTMRKRDVGRYGVTDEEGWNYGFSRNEKRQANRNIEAFGAGIERMEDEYIPPEDSPTPGTYKQDIKKRRKIEQRDFNKSKISVLKGEDKRRYNGNMRTAGASLNRMEREYGIEDRPGVNQNIKDFGAGIGRMEDEYGLIEQEGQTPKEYKKAIKNRREIEKRDTNRSSISVLGNADRGRYNGNMRTAGASLNRMEEENQGR